MLIDYIFHVKHYVMTNSSYSFGNELLNTYDELVTRLNKYTNYKSSDNRLWNIFTNHTRKRSTNVIILIHISNYETRSYMSVIKLTSDMYPNSLLYDPESRSINIPYKVPKYVFKRTDVKKFSELDMSDIIDHFNVEPNQSSINFNIFSNIDLDNCVDNNQLNDLLSINPSFSKSLSESTTHIHSYNDIVRRSYKSLLSRYRYYYIHDDLTMILSNRSYKLCCNQTPKYVVNRFEKSLWYIVYQSVMKALIQTFTDN